MSQASIIRKIKSIDVDTISHVLFTENNGKEYPIYLHSIKQIAFYFNNIYHKSEFQPMELAKI
jgi:hypothetical protein